MKALNCIPAAIFVMPLALALNSPTPASAQTATCQLGEGTFSNGYIVRIGSFAFQCLDSGWTERDDVPGMNCVYADQTYSQGSQIVVAGENAPNNARVIACARTGEWNEI